MGLVDKIKKESQKAGQNKGKFIYFREGQKTRIRFLTDMDAGMEVEFHDSFELSINAPCQETFGKSCPNCGDDSLRTRSQYIWSVWNYETNEVQLFMFPVNNCTPVPAIMAMFETYGTIIDRDFVISFTGKQQNKTYSVVPMDKVKFRNEKAKPFADKLILKMLDKAFPCENADEDDEEEEEAPKKKTKPTSKAAAKPTSKSKKVEEEEDDEDEEEKPDYSEMTPKELFDLCKEREIKVAPKKPAKYYITLLVEYDEAHSDWEEEEEEDEWEDE